MRGLPILGLCASLALAACSDDGATTGAGGSARSGGPASSSSDGSTGSAVSTSSVSGSTSTSTSTGGGAGGGGCVVIDDTAEVEIGAAAAAGEHTLELFAVTASVTSWREPGNEALVLDVSTPDRAIGQLVLHQGADGATYGMTLGALAAGESVRLRVSTLSAASAVREVCVSDALLTEASSLGDAAEGVVNAPIFKWPVQKRFDDLPVMLGWSRAKKQYQAYYTNENGGTVESCGGGAEGMQAEIARWGRGSDIESAYSYGGAKTWGRCTGSTSFAQVMPRMEGEHPTFYYGDGHNRLFEHRGGYSQTCGSGSAEAADGALDGWDANNPGNAAVEDGPFVITLRPLPVDLDAIGYDAFGGRREGAADRYAPWLYRITDHENAREGRIDGDRVQTMENYVYVDVHAADVGGSGDSYCTFTVANGFRLRIATPDGVRSGQQMTADYFGGQNNIKRVAFPLGAAYDGGELTALTFDAYDNDGIYFLDLGDVFVVKPVGENGAVIDYAHQGVLAVDQYVDDDSSNCPNGMNPDGPNPPYPCVGGSTTVTLP